MSNSLPAIRVFRNSNSRMKAQALVVFALAWLCMAPLLAQDPVKPNIICIVADDLNDYTTTLQGHPQCETPNISRLESWGTTFTNAHCSSPRCAPSRASFMTGKDVAYTQIYNNNTCKPFREYFTPAKNNADVFTLPEVLKDAGGYYTYGLGKIEHCWDTYPDLDITTTDDCARSLSWSRYSWFYAGEETVVRVIGDDNNAGVESFGWSPLNDTLEPYMYDYRAVDSASAFFRQYAEDPGIACNRPFMLMLGMRKPHIPLYVPEKYFDADYVEDYFQYPMDIPYNTPVNTFPFNGFVMPPQPDTLYSDYYDLPETGLAQFMAAYDSVYHYIMQEIDHLDSLPALLPGLSEEERHAAMMQIISANAAMAYVAAVRFLDVQVGRLIDSLSAYPELFNNTIFIFVSDHGFSLGEKRHWKKGTMWETDQRIPFVIADMRAPAARVADASVSLLDLFPTVCDLSATPRPVFPDGSPYADGLSLMPFLTAAYSWTRPALSTFKEFYPNQLGCYPTYSIRDNRFHYIRYRSNGAPGETACDADSSFYEEELYDIGTHRETDPNEWHNLADNPDYAPLIDYLQQWLPDSALYMQQTYTAQIEHDASVCFLDATDTLHLAVTLKDTAGIPVSLPETFTCVWNTPLLDTLFYGTEVVFPVSSLPDSLFDNTAAMIWYVQVIDTADVVRALDLHIFYIDPENAPEVTFTVAQLDPATVQVQDIVTTGVYSDIIWDFGDGSVFHVDAPGPYTYLEPGPQLITGTLIYGNDDLCSTTYAVEAYAHVITPVEIPAIWLYPNPSDGTFYLTVDMPVSGGLLHVWNAGGALVYAEKFSTDPWSGGMVRLSDLPAGVYHVQLTAEQFTDTAPLILIGPHTNR